MLVSHFMCVLLCGDHTSGCSHIHPVCLTSRPGLFLIASPLCRLIQIDMVSF